MSGPLPLATYDLAVFAKRIVVAGIKSARDDPSELKHRIMIARECGFLDDEETEFYIAAWGLVEA